jgi:lipoprotein-anchoring transpeptidase ErfK/SrfK
VSAVRAGLLTAVAVLISVALAACGGNTEPTITTTTAPARTTTGPANTTTAPPGDGSQLSPEPTLQGPLAFQLRRRAQLRSAPAGKVLHTLRTKTSFGSPRILAVASRRPGWVGVRTETVANGKIGWVPSSAGVFFSEPRTITIDLSKRQLTVLHRGKVVGRWSVAVGAPATHTPIGTFAVTDRLHTGTSVGPYGCCILALTARQPNLAQGWGGGDRIAIHATSNVASIGKSVSNGCIRMREAPMRRLMRQIRLGAPVRIHA